MKLVLHDHWKDSCSPSLFLLGSHKKIYYFIRTKSKLAVVAPPCVQNVNKTNYSRVLGNLEM